MITPQRNVDEAELAKFDAVASRWWDPEGEFGSLHDINPLRLDWIRQHVDLRGLSVVDIGCGGGILSESLAAAGATVTGIDMAEGPLTVARLHQLETGAGVEYLQCTAEDLAGDRPGSYDVVTCLELLEHVPSPAGIVRAAETLLKPGGHAFFSTINRSAKAFLFAIVGAEHLLRLLPAGTHEYSKFIRPSELESWARAAGLMLCSSTGMHYNPLTRQYWLAAGLGVNYLMHFTRPEAE